MSQDRWDKTSSCARVVPQIFVCSAPRALECYVRKIFIFGKIFATKERKERIDINSDCLFSLRSFVLFCGKSVFGCGLAALCLCASNPAHGFSRRFAEAAEKSREIKFFLMAGFPAIK
jgi:hypothetical protein